MGVERRRLPLQVEPLEGESLDSWLEATALAAGLTTGALAAVGGLSTHCEAVLEELAFANSSTGASCGHRAADEFPGLDH
jgi:hypothetical protein